MLILLIVCIYTNVSAQKVKTETITQEVYKEYDIASPFNIVRLEISLDSSVVRVFYWEYRYIAGIRFGKKRYHDCYLDWNINHTYLYTNQLFNAWIRENYDTE